MSRNAGTNTPQCSSLGMTTTLNTMVFIHQGSTMFIKPVKTENVFIGFLVFQNILVHLRAVGKLALHAEATNKTRQTNI